MRLLEKLAIVGLALLITSCCCFGGFDTDDNDDIDTGYTGPHSEGSGGDM